MHPAGDFLAAATSDSAPAIGLGAEVGEIATGRHADLILVSGLTHLLGTGDLAGAVVTALGPADVHTVVAAGRVVKRDGRLVDLDLADLRRRAAESLGHAFGGRS